MKFWSVDTTVEDGLRHVDGRPHGINWVKRYDLVIRFDSEEERAEFTRKLEEGERCDTTS